MALAKPAAAPAITIEDVRDMLRNVNEAKLLFDKIFSQISPTQSYNDNIARADIELPLALVSDSQCAAIAELSGYLIRIHSILETHYLRQVQATSSLAIFPSVPLDMAHDHSSTLMLERRCQLLQDFLVSELVRSEELDARVRDLEEKLLNANTEKGELRKELRRIRPPRISSSSSSSPSSPSSSCSSVSSSPRAPAQTAGSVSTSASTSKHKPSQEYIRRFIRKSVHGKFYFGLVAQFSGSLYRIVYENAHCENLRLEEVQRYLWRDTIPERKRKACFQHARVLNLLPSSRNTGGGAPIEDAPLSSSVASSTAVAVVGCTDVPVQGGEERESRGRTETPKLASIFTTRRSSSSLANASKEKDQAQPPPQPPLTAVRSQRTSATDEPASCSAPATQTNTDGACGGDRLFLDKFNAPAVLSMPEPGTAQGVGRSPVKISSVKGQLLSQGSDRSSSLSRQSTSNSAASIPSQRGHVDGAVNVWDEHDDEEIDEEDDEEYDEKEEERGRGWNGGIHRSSRRKRQRGES